MERVWVAGLGSRRRAAGAADFGVGSDQTQNVLWRLLNGELGGHPKVAVVMIGTNDLGYGPQRPPPASRRRRDDPNRFTRHEGLAARDSSSLEPQ